MSSTGVSRRRIVILAVALTLCGAGFATAGEPRYWVVVHPDNPTVILRRDEVSRLFLKKLVRWSDGRPAKPVDLDVANPARDAFSREVHQRPAAAIRKYWQQMVYSGQSAPPPEVATEAEVLSMVRSNPGAIGYVSDEATLKGVKIVDIVAPPPPASESDPPAR